MIAIDTNVFVRILVDDPEEIAQTETARNLARAAKQIYVPQIVQVECVWVLETAYHIGKSELLRILEIISENSAFVLQHSDCFAAALEMFRHANADFSDCLILAESQEQEMTLFTFDKRLSQLTGAKNATNAAKKK